MHNKPKKLILIDLDGVLNNYVGNYEENSIPSVKDGAFEFLQKISQEYRVKIFTTRNKALTENWLVQNKLDRFVKDVTNIKEPASLYIDDRCISFKGDFKQALNEVKEYKPYWVK